MACSALGALSLTGQAYVDVKRAEGLTGPTSLFLLTIADSGERKSTCDKFFTEPIHDYERQQTEAAQPACADYRAALAAWESSQTGIKDNIRQKAKKGQIQSTSNARPCGGLRATSPCHHGYRGCSVSTKPLKTSRGCSHGSGQRLG